MISRIARTGLRINVNKSIFIEDTHVSPAPILGYEIFKGKLQVPSESIKGLLELQTPKDTKELQSLLGGLNFIRNFLGLDILQQMNFLSQQMHPFTWNEECDKIFVNIKNRLVAGDLILQFPTQNELMVLTCDASNLGCGGTLLSVKLSDLDMYIDKEVKLHATLKTISEVCLKPTKTSRVETKDKLKIILLAKSALLLAQSPLTTAILQLKISLWSCWKRYHQPRTE